MLGQLYAVVKTYHEFFEQQRMLNMYYDARISALAKESVQPISLTVE